MAPDFLALATTLENLGARRLLAKKVNFVPCYTKFRGVYIFGSWTRLLTNFVSGGRAVLLQQLNKQL